MQDTFRYILKVFGIRRHGYNWNSHIKSITGSRCSWVRECVQMDINLVVVFHTFRRIMLMFENLNLWIRKELFDVCDIGFVLEFGASKLLSAVSTGGPSAKVKPEYQKVWSLKSLEGELRFPPGLANWEVGELRFELKGFTRYRPVTLEQLLKVKQQDCSSKRRTGCRYRLIKTSHSFTGGHESFLDSNYGLSYSALFLTGVHTGLSKWPLWVGTFFGILLATFRN